MAGHNRAGEPSDPRDPRLQARLLRSMLNKQSKPYYAVPLPAYRAAVLRSFFGSLKKLHNIPRDADALHLKYAARMRNGMREVEEYLKSIKAPLETYLRSPTVVRLDPREVLCELRALFGMAGFEKITWNLRLHTLIVTTVPISLTDPGTDQVYDFGRFEIHLNYRDLALSSGTRYYLVPLEPNFAKTRTSEETPHPHVSAGVLCEGDAQVPIANALRQGRFTDFFLIVLSVLRTYNDGSPYVSLDEWDGLPCKDCGQAVPQRDADDEESNRTCAYSRCEGPLCHNCGHDCSDCGETRCHAHSDACEGCNQRCCFDCLNACVDCDTAFCRECLGNGDRCQRCREKAEAEEEAAAEAAAEAEEAAIHARSLAEQEELEESERAATVAAAAAAEDSAQLVEPVFRSSDLTTAVHDTRDDEPDAARRAAVQRIHQLMDHVLSYEDDHDPVPGLVQANNESLVPVAQNDLDQSIVNEIIPANHRAFLAERFGDDSLRHDSGITGFLDDPVGESSVPVLPGATDGNVGDSAWDDRDPVPLPGHGGADE